MSKRRRARNTLPVGKMILTFLLVTVMAIASGYGLTKYIIKPLFLGAGDEDLEVPQTQDFQGSSIIVGQQSIDEKEDDDIAAEIPETSNVLYSIQYGSFSDKEGAEAMASSLAASNISVIVLEREGAYKLIGSPYITKEEAGKSLEEAKAVLGDDPFITSVEVKMK
ncbi:MAG TPA: SPOR domain-containing protein [Anaerovoracaceae bacterium]|nr:SPOR domain-containing protein [Anaerovoracaceae bacterium]